MVSMITPSLYTLFTVAQKKGYTFFQDDQKDCNLNIWGIRSYNNTPGTFNDLIVVFYKYKGEWAIFYFPATTDPGLYWLDHPMNPDKGCAVLKPGQYRGAYELGLHKGKYEALVQRKPVTVYRVKNRSLLNRANLPEETGYFGLNCHRAGKNAPSRINEYTSAGCQAVACPVQYDFFINLCRIAVRNWGKYLSYTLIEENDLYFL